MNWDEIDGRINYIFKENDVKAFEKQSDDDENLVLPESQVESDDNYECSSNKDVRSEKKEDQQPSTSAGRPKQYEAKNSESRTKTLEPTEGSDTTRLPKICVKKEEKMKTPLKVWSLLFPDKLLGIIVKHTNEEIERSGESDQKTNLTEIKAFIGLLYFAGLQKDRHKDTEKMWEEEGCTMYRAVMTRTRFNFLSSRIRFDNKTTREDRQTADRLTAIREIWNQFIKNCIEYYDTPSQNWTGNADEQLLKFGEKFPQAIKIFYLNDFKTFYMLNAIPCTDNDEIKIETVYEDKDYIRRLKDKGVTDEDIETFQIVHRYNSTKNKTSKFYLLCKRYSTSRKTMRWTMRLFFFMLDQGVVNSNILYNLIIDEKHLMNKYNFTKRLVLMLIAPHMQNNLQKRLKITLDIKLESVDQSMIHRVLKMDPPFEDHREINHCTECEILTTLCCILCKKPYCNKHRTCIKRINCDLHQKYFFCFSCFLKWEI